MRWRVAEHKKKYLAPICAGDARSTVAFLEVRCQLESGGYSYGRCEWQR